jgi:hypothetical protein
MGQGANVLFNFVTVIFLALTLLVGLIVLGVASGSMETPILAPDATQPPPTPFIAPTFTPTMSPADLTATAQPMTPTPGS